MDRAPCLKGIVFREFVQWYEQTRGRDAALRAYDSLTPELRAHLDPQRDYFGLLPGSWYSVHIATGMLEAITWGVGPEERTAMLRAGVEHAVGVTLTGVYRVLFQTLVTPDRHAKYAQKIWSNYYNTGTVEGRILGPGRAEQLVIDWNGHHPLLCELSIHSLTAFHAHMGCQNVKVSRSQCVLDRQPASRPRVPLSAPGVRTAPPSSVQRMASASPAPKGCRFLITWEAER
jgi:hypothetical protein